MARLSVAQGPCSAVLQTVHGCHYAFQKLPFLCVTLYNRRLNVYFIIYKDNNNKNNNNIHFTRMTLRN